MNAAGIQETLGRLRKLAEDIQADTRPREDVASELFNLACSVAIAFEDSPSMAKLVDRAWRYGTTVQSDFFQQMCELAAHFVLLRWRENKSGEFRLWSDVDEFILAAEKVEEKMLLLASLLRQSCGATSGDADHARAAPAMPTLDTMKVDLRDFGVRQNGPSIGHALPTHIKRLKRISQYLGNPVQLARVISYFDGLMAWATSNLLWGSFWIDGCYTVRKSPDSFHRTKLFCDWLKLDPQGIVQAMLAAAEDLAVKTHTDDPDAPSTQLPTAGKVDGKRQQNKAKRWHTMDEKPPADVYFESPLQGEKADIAWALAEAKSMSGDTPRILDSKVNSGLFWGQQENRKSFLVYLPVNHGREKLKRAQDAMQAIQTRGPYRQRKQRLPKGYKKYETQSLRASSQELLAQALDDAGILKDATIHTLHDVLRKGGVLFGRYENGDFTLFLDDRLPLNKVRKAKQILKTKLSAMTSSSS
jgi:hypothetical protein